jgi:hypothetical protein
MMRRADRGRCLAVSQYNAIALHKHPIAAAYRRNRRTEFANVSSDLRDLPPSPSWRAAPGERDAAIQHAGVQIEPTLHMTGDPPVPTRRIGSRCAGARAWSRIRHHFRYCATMRTKQPCTSAPSNSVAARRSCRHCRTGRKCSGSHCDFNESRSVFNIRPLLSSRRRRYPLYPGDFVQLPTVSAGQQSGFSISRKGIAPVRGGRVETQPPRDALGEQENGDQAAGWLPESAGNWVASATLARHGLCRSRDTWAFV